MPLGTWMMFAGGSLAQLLLPVVLGAALFIRNRDTFGAAIGLWLLGASMIDLAPYIYDSLHPVFMSIKGEVGGESHDWIYLLNSVGLLKGAHGVGRLAHYVGSCLLLAGLAWAAWVLKLEWQQLKTSRAR